MVIHSRKRTNQQSYKVHSMPTRTIRFEQISRSYKKLLAFAFEFLLKCSNHSNHWHWFDKRLTLLTNQICNMQYFIISCQHIFRQLWKWKEEKVFINDKLVHAEVKKVSVWHQVSEKKNGTYIQFSHFGTGFKIYSVELWVFSAKS